MSEPHAHLTNLLIKWNFYWSVNTVLVSSNSKLPLRIISKRENFTRLSKKPRKVVTALNWRNNIVARIWGEYPLWRVNLIITFAPLPTFSLLIGAPREHLTTFSQKQIVSGSSLNLLDLQRHCLNFLNQKGSCRELELAIAKPKLSELVRAYREKIAILWQYESVSCSTRHLFD